MGIIYIKQADFNVIVIVYSNVVPIKADVNITMNKYL